MFERVLNTPLDLSYPAQIPNGIRGIGENKENISHLSVTMTFKIVYTGIAYTKIFYYFKRLHGTVF